MDQQPSIFHSFFFASAQMQGQHVFLSAKRSLAHLISAMISAPSVSMAVAQALMVLSISIAHSNSKVLVHSALIHGAMGISTGAT